MVCRNINFLQRTIIMSNSKLKNTALPQILPLTHWKKHFPYPSQGTMRNIVARREENNASEFLSMIHGRFYVNVEKFHIWLEKQSILRKKNEE